ncbi:MAG: ATP-binding cassette domain-containing protein [Candidatus Marinimicrobia bacterium]|nr:ATP-binding cassette domain-containing protein [Candidatus Neomarinimicrobiota bacterium]
MSIVLQNLSKQFGDQLVVHDVSLEILDGELFVLLGSSGSGKSTILRIIAGLLEPDKGSVAISGQDVTGLSTQQRDVGFVFQNYSLFRHMNVFENVEFGLRVRKVGRNERRARAKELLEIVGLTGFGDRYPQQLSGGQMQRVAVARALAYKPAVLLLDEPFGALDVKIRSSLRQSLRNIQQKLKVTTILVTHDQEEAFELADRIGVIDHGQLIEAGPVDELYNRPRTETVATFIGGGNVLVGREVDGLIQLGEIKLPWPAKAPLHAQGSPVRVLFRPETVLIQKMPFENRENLMRLGSGKIVKRIFNGPMQRFVIELDQLQGVRPLVPAPPYGLAKTRIDIVKTTDHVGNDLMPGNKCWIAITDFHVLEPSGIKFLALVNPAPMDSAAADMACGLSEQAQGFVTLISVVKDESAVQDQEADLQELKRRWQNRTPRLTTRVLQGEIRSVLFQTVQTGGHDLLLMDSTFTSMEGHSAEMGWLWTHLHELGIPVMFVEPHGPELKHILVCTAAGEQGKTDIQVAGRLALRTHTPITVMTVLTPDVDQAEEARVIHHLKLAKDSLSALEVDCTTLIRKGLPFDEIIAETTNPGYGLIVIGASYPVGGRGPAIPSTTQRIVDQVKKSILIVPMGK